MLIFAILAIFMNIMDSVTTELGARQYPDSERKWEANPFARKIMLKSPLLMEILKQVIVTSMVIVLVYAQDIFSLKIIAIALSVVVANNSFIVISRHITKRKIISPAKKLQQIFHTPEKLIYPMMLAVIFGLTALIMTIL